ncbi:S8 family serine peptidase [Streptomyces sp. SBST2-5]|uniref:S8 family serine peptidase n=1 Tax=Streptomyces composti TaxID=2720025 RepID=A0ABX1ACK7_9ACTN|nr:S8 family serine peptidase [Streptomyces composti]
MAGPASATGPADGAGEAQRRAGAQRQGAVSTGVVKHRVTLITGDRVAVDAKGRVVGVERAEGRERIPVQIRRVGGHTYVMPTDVVRLVLSGKLDRRLFDVTELTRAAVRGAHKRGLKVIVGYKGGARSAKAEVRDAGTLRRTLKTLNADAVQTPHRDTSELWKAVTDGDRTASGIDRVWLDGVRKAHLDTSVGQIGTPKAWSAGYDGKGVKIAVLDTGVDAKHPDLKNKVIAARNFTSSPNAGDKVGHGTHVASIAAGSGARSGGRYKGVAPGAKILNGKVLDDDGFGDDSEILAGMEWAVQQGADVINMSLGGPDSPDIDPLEAAVDRLTAEKGVLFAVAAGNSGPESLGSPGTADAALTVGAVDGKDRLADFSSTGPRLGDGAAKPDVTAPGVDITAASARGNAIAREEGEKPAGYMTISGTSMATPHVAGAAAILKQQHPQWRATELKAALVASAKGGRYTPFQQGTGRVQIDKAVRQTVVAEPVSLGFGVQQWPHTDDRPVTKKLTYRNSGTKDVTLKLTASATGPKGKAAPAGFFRLGAKTLKVPAGGEASVGLTVNTRLGGKLDGAYAAVVSATGGGQSVRTAAHVMREVESYDVTFRHIGRDGRAPADHFTSLFGYAGLGHGRQFQVPPTEKGTTTLRLPKGTYALDSVIKKDPETAGRGLDWTIQPKLAVTRKTTVTIDARKTRAADITVPDAKAKPRSASISYVLHAGDGGLINGYDAASFAELRLAHLGPQVTGLTQTWSGHWTKDASADYIVAASARVKKIQGHKVKHYKAGELATVKHRLGAPTAGKTGAVTAFGEFADDWVVGGGVEQKLPATRTQYLSTSDKVRWAFAFQQYSGARDDEGYPVPDAEYSETELRTLKPAKKYTKTFNTAVFGPRLNADSGLFREDNTIYGRLPLFADGQGHFGQSQVTSATTTLYRNGKKVGSTDDPLFGEAAFTVPSGDAAYRLTTSVKRSVKVAAASTRIDASWTFRSKKPADLAQLPASTVRFQAATGLDSRVPAGRKTTFPVKVEGSARGKNLKSLSVHVSYDYGKTWKKIPVKKGRITVKNPAKGKAVSFHAKITDKRNNKSTISIYNAYYGK